MRAQWDGDQPGSPTVGGYMQFEVNSCGMRLSVTLSGDFKKALLRELFCVQSEEDRSMGPGVTWTAETGRA